MKILIINTTRVSSNLITIIFIATVCSLNTISAQSILNKPLIQILSYSYSHLQGEKILSQDPITGIVIHIYPEDIHSGYIHAYDIKTNTIRRKEEIIYSFYYDVKTTPLLFPSDDSILIPANFYGQMGPLLIIYHTPKESKLLWFHLENEYLIMDSINPNAIISYIDENIYEIIEYKNAEWKYSYFNTHSLELTHTLPEVRKVMGKPLPYFN